METSKMVTKRCPYCEEETSVFTHMPTPCHICGHTLFPCGECEAHCTWSPEMECKKYPYKEDDLAFFTTYRADVPQEVLDETDDALLVIFAVSQDTYQKYLESSQKEVQNEQERQFFTPYGFIEEYTWDDTVWLYKFAAERKEILYEGFPPAVTLQSLLNE